MSAQRSLWIQYAGGNLRDWQLFTATRTKTKPRQLAFVEQDVELPSPIVVGQGTLAAVPYAVKQTVTYLGDNGAAVFKWTAPASVRLLASGSRPGRGAGRGGARFRRRLPPLRDRARSCGSYTLPGRARSPRSPWRRPASSSRTARRSRSATGRGVRRRSRCRRARRCSATARAASTSPSAGKLLRAEGLDRYDVASRRAAPGRRRSARSPRRAASPGRSATGSAGPASACVRLVN